MGIPFSSSAVICECRSEWNPTCVAASGHCELGRFWDVAFGTELGRILGKKEGGGLPKKFKNPNKNGLFEDYKSSALPTELCWLNYYHPKGLARARPASATPKVLKAATR